MGTVPFVSNKTQLENKVFPDTKGTVPLKNLKIFTICEICSNFAP